MKRLFIYHPLFRLLSPLFIGVMVYLLILLIHNNVEQLQEQFLGQELYLCIGLAYAIQEVSLLLLFLFRKVRFIKSALLKTSFQIVISLAVCVLVVTAGIYAYYDYFEGYSPSMDEIWMFNAVFCIMASIYILMYVSHQYLHKINSKKLESEIIAKEITEREFQQFKSGINPNLFFESLEALLVLIHEDKEKSDDFIDQLAAIYRYILMNRDKELIPVQEELEALAHLPHLFEQLPYRKFKINAKLTSDFLVIPASLMHLVEKVIRGCINTHQKSLEINLTENQDQMQISYVPKDRIMNPLSIESITEIKRAYKIYSNSPVDINEEDQLRIISLPKLQIQAP